MASATPGWSWERIEAPSRIAAGDDLTVPVRLRNTGRQAGKQVVAQVRVAPRAFQHWSVADHAWRAEPGTFRVTAGPSVMDQPLPCDVEVTQEPSVGLPTNPPEGESPAQAPPARGRRRAT